MENIKKQQVGALLNQTYNLFTRIERDDLATEIKSLQDRLKTTEKTIVVCGEFKRGKSSLINALIQQVGLCPVDIDIATAVVSIIRYDENPSVVRWFGNVGGESKEEIAFDDIEKYAVGDSKDLASTWMLEIEAPIEVLKGGLSIVDTPGVGGLDPRHGFLSSYFLPRADVVLFTIDASEPMTASELCFLKEKCNTDVQELVVVLNKIDLCDEVDILISDVRSKLIDVLGDLGKEISIIPVSSSLMKEFLLDGNQEDYVESNYENLLTKINEVTIKHDEKIINWISYSVLELLNDIYQPLFIQSKQYTSSEHKTKGKLESEYKKQRKQIEEYEGPAASWGIILNSNMNHLKMDAIFQLKDRIIDLTHKKLRQILETEGIDIELDDVIMKIENEISSIANGLDRFISDRMLQIYSEVTDDLFIDKHALSLSDETFKYTFESSEGINETGKIKAMFSTANLRNAIFATGVAQVPIVGWAAALYLVFDGVKTSLERAKRENIQKINNAISADVQKSTLALQKHVDNRIKESEVIMKKMIQFEIDRIKKTSSEIQDVLEAQRKRTAKEKAQYEKIVNTQLRPIEQLKKYFERLLITYTDVRD